MLKVQFMSTILAYGLQSHTKLLCADGGMVAVKRDCEVG